MAAVMDRHSRRIVGWSLSHRRDAALTTQALRQAARNRSAGPGVLFHSDRGIEYAAFEFRDQLARLGMFQSMNRAGKMNDNAHMESFFHSMKTEDCMASFHRRAAPEASLGSATSPSTTSSDYIRRCATSHLPIRTAAGPAILCQLKRCKFPPKGGRALRTRLALGAGYLHVRAHEQLLA